MIRKKILQRILLFCCFLLVSVAHGQNTTSPDGLFLAARKAVVDEDNYLKAKNYLFRALKISPDYADARTFLGKIYSWTKKDDSAGICFSRVLKTNPGYEDAVLAYTDLEYNNDYYSKALEICKSGLQYHPNSEELLLRLAKIYNVSKRFDEAGIIVKRLLTINRLNGDAVILLQKIRDSLTKSNSPAANNVIISVTPPLPFQDTTSSDGLLQAARKAAFDNKDYARAKNYLYKAIQLSPNYGDLKIFLGRIHTWTENYDSARFYFNEVLKANPGYEDASTAYIDMEYWNDNNNKALGIVEEGLKYHPASQNLLLRKAKILNAMRRYKEADIAVGQVLHIDKNNTAARSLAGRIKELSTKNKISLSYDYIYFDKQFNDPWHLASFDYTRRTGIGSVTGRINYANRFTENGVQYEAEAYPHISKTFYSYISAGYSDNVGVFPQWRGGFSLYANLPKSYEGEIGVRYLKFSGDPTWIYTAYIGKYYKSWLFSGRTYLTPGTFTNTVSTSYSAAARYYYGSADDMIGGTFGYGISPDDRLNAIQLDSKIKLVSYKAGLFFKKKVSKMSVISIDGSWYNQEYLPQTKGNQYQISIGWLFRF